MIEPDWPAPPNVRALVTTRDFGDLARPDAKQKLRRLLPGDPVWLKQVHGRNVVDAGKGGEADAAVTRAPGTVCAVFVADCMPVLLADDAGKVVGIAHAGWRGLAAGVIEATLDAMNAKSVMAWLGPAIGPKVYEVGEDVHAAFSKYPQAFTPNRPGHWLFDLYAVARQKLTDHGVRQIYGGGFCTYSDAKRFFSYRRDRSGARMAALIWFEK